MTNQTSHTPVSDTEPENTARDESAPRWVKVFGIVAVIAILVVVIIHVLGGGFHGHAMQ